MSKTSPVTAELNSAIDKFWETVPPAWHKTRAHIRRLAAEQYSLTVEQFQVLRRVRKGVNSVSALAEANQTSRSSASKAVDALVNKGLLARVTDKNDRRHVQLSLTAEGEKLLSALYNQTRQWMAEKFKTLEARELALIVEAMTVLSRAFQESPPAGKK